MFWRRIEIAWLFAARLLLGRSAWFPGFNIRQIRFLDEIDAGDFCCLQSFLMNQLKDPLTANAQNLGGLGGRDVFMVSLRHDGIMTNLLSIQKQLLTTCPLTTG